MEPLKRFVFQTKNRQKYLTVHLSITFLFLSLLHAVRISVPFFRGEASRFCCSWVFFVCVSCLTHSFLLSFTSLVWVQAVAEITSCLGNFTNFSRSASPGLKQGAEKNGLFCALVWSEWIKFFFCDIDKRWKTRMQKSANKNRSILVVMQACTRARNWKNPRTAQWLEFTHAQCWFVEVKKLCLKTLN